MSLKYISLFSGGFGLDLGIEQASNELACSINPVICVDIDKWARKTIKRNRPHLTVIGDDKEDAEGNLYQISTEFILRRSNLVEGEADIIVGGPPCQAFSILGNRQGFNDLRGGLVLEFIRVVREARPRCFVMENVSGFLSVDKGSVWRRVEELFQLAGYNTIYRWVINAVDYGVPQFRERVFIVGFREDVIKAGALAKPVATHRPPAKIASSTKSPLPLSSNNVANDTSNGTPADNRPLYRCVQDVLRNMENGLPNHQPRVHGERVASRYELLAPGERDAIDHTDRLRWDWPSGTVLVGSSRGGGRPFIHPELPRHLTVREAARLQGFGDEWVFEGGQTNQYRQVGNAVPPLLSKAVIKQIVPCLLFG